MNGIGVIIIFCATFSTGDAWNVVKTLSVSNGGKWGEWKHTEYCRPGTYAVGYSMKVGQIENKVDGDDSALNAIKLKCSDDATITSGVGPWGNWGSFTNCPENTVFVSFSLQVEDEQGDGDDSAANFIKFGCRHIGASSDHKYVSVHSAGRGFWGNYGSWSHSCSTGTAIYGKQTRIESPQNDGDDTALNNVRIFCCDG